MPVEAPTKVGETPPVFTPEQISAVLAKLREDPNLIRKLIASAQGEEEEDLVFMLESGRAFWTDINKGGSHIT